jgi:hypothetical protein
MELVKSYSSVKYFIIDILLLIALYLLPAISHALVIPFYLVDPMRIMIFVSILLTNKKNSYLLALTIPLFSFLIDSHPVLIKSVLIASELSFNLFLFYSLYKKTKNIFVITFLSIAVSKVFYYFLKYVAIETGLLNSSLISTSLWIQLVLTTVISLAVWFISEKFDKKFVS